MSYLPFTFVEAIHAEKNAQIRTYQRRHNDDVMPRPALPPDPIGLLFSQIHSALDRGIARAIQTIFYAAPAGNGARTSNVLIDQRRQPPANVVAK